MSVTLHGIKNCDSVKRARQWLQAEGIVYQFRDFRQSPPSATEIANWLQYCSLQALLNKRSTTWKSLGQGDKDSADDKRTAIELLAQHPTMIKRPVVTADGLVLVGFDAAHYASVFCKQ